MLAGEAQPHSPFWTETEWVAKLDVRVQYAREIAGSEVSEYPHLVINQAWDMLQSLNPPAQMIVRLIPAPTE